MAVLITRKQQSLHKQEMEAVLARQQQLEEMNHHLCQRAGEVQTSFRDLDLSQDKYQELRNLPDDKISIQEYVAVRDANGRRKTKCVVCLWGLFLMSFVRLCLDAFLRGSDSPPVSGGPAQREDRQSD